MTETSDQENNNNNNTSNTETENAESDSETIQNRKQTHTQTRRRSSFQLRHRKHKRKHHTVHLRDGRTMDYLVDGPRELEKDPSQIKASGLPVVFAFHGMYLSGESLIQTDHYRELKQQLSLSSRSVNGSKNLSTVAIASTSTSISTSNTTRFTTTTTPIPNSPDYVVIAVNRAGYHGSSPVTLGEYSYREFALDIREIADALQISRFGVVGHSSGGPNALACAAILGPARVGAFGTLASDPEYSRFDDIPYDPLLDCCIGVCLPRVLGMCLPCLRVSNGMRNDYLLERQDYSFECESIEQPGVVIAGEADHLLPGWLTKRVIDRLANARYRVVPGAGHEDLLEDQTLDAAYRSVIQLMTATSTNGGEDWDNLPITQLIRAREQRNQQWQQQQ